MAALACRPALPVTPGKLRRLSLKARGASPARGGVFYVLRRSRTRAEGGVCIFSHPFLGQTRHSCGSHWMRHGAHSTCAASSCRCWHCRENARRPPVRSSNLPFPLQRLRPSCRACRETAGFSFRPLTPRRRAASGMERGAGDCIPLYSACGGAAPIKAWADPAEWRDALDAAEYASNPRGEPEPW